MECHVVFYDLFGIFPRFAACLVVLGFEDRGEAANHGPEAQGFGAMALEAVGHDQIVELCAAP